MIQREGLSLLLVVLLFASGNAQMSAGETPESGRIQPDSGEAKAGEEKKAPEKETPTPETESSGPESAEPKAAEPKSTEPKATEPKVTEPKAAEPKPAGTEGEAMSPEPGQGPNGHPPLKPPEIETGKDRVLPPSAYLPAEEIKLPSPIPEAKIELKLSLEEAVQWAMSKNLGILAEEQNYNISRRDVVVARATFDPRFNVSTSFTSNRDPSLNVLEVGGSFGGPGISVVAVSPTDVFNMRGGFTGLTPIGTTYEISLLESRFNNPQAPSFITGLNPRYNSRVQFSLTQPLLKGAWQTYNTAGIRTAINNIQLSREQLELVAINIAFNVESAYWDLVFALKNFQSRGKALQVTWEQLRMDEKKVEVGTKAHIDITTSQSQVAARKTEYDVSASLVEDARDKLLDSINFAGTEESLKALLENHSRKTSFKKYSDIKVIPTTEPETTPIQPDRSASIGLAFENRVEYRQIALQIENQNIAINVAKNELLPKLDLNANWAQLGLDGSFDGSLSTLTTGRFYDWTVGATLEVPLSLRGPRARYRNARDVKQRLNLEKQNLENSIVLEVDKAIRDLDYAYRTAKNLEQQVSLQKIILEAEITKLDVGKSIAYTVALIENDLVSYEAQWLRAKADYEIAKAAYEKAVGRLLERRGVDLGRE